VNTLDKLQRRFACRWVAVADPRLRSLTVFNPTFVFWGELVEFCYGVHLSRDPLRPPDRPLDRTRSPAGPTRPARPARPTDPTARPARPSARPIRRSADSSGLAPQSGWAPRALGGSGTRPSP